MVEADNGSVVEVFDETDLSAMTNSIVSAAGVDMVDDGKNIVSQIYAGDMEGQMFAFRDNDDSSDPKLLDGIWQTMHLFSATSSGKKIFGEVDFVPEFIQYFDDSSSSWETVVGDYVFFGTGDRAHPLRTDNVNYFYCVKNDWHTGEITVGKTVSDFATLDEDPSGDLNNTDNDLVMIDVTNVTIQDVADAVNKKYNRGWYLQLEGNGEKCLSTPVVYSGVVYFTTFTPADASAGGASSDPCEDPSTGGTAKLYAIDYKTGAPVYNFTTTNDTEETTLGKEDRYKILDQYNITIAPNPLLIITDKGEKLSIGPQTEDVKSPKSGVNMFYWIQDN
jgi:type IV pilus assembly protein PilY1